MIRNDRYVDVQLLREQGFEWQRDQLAELGFGLSMSGRRVLCSRLRQLGRILYMIQPRRRFLSHGSPIGECRLRRRVRRGSILRYISLTLAHFGADDDWYFSKR